MGFFNLLVFCVVILVVTGDSGPEEQDSFSSTLVYTRLKRESEFDSHAAKSKILAARRPAKLLIPIKHKTPVHTHLPIPRRNLLLNNPKTLKNDVSKEYNNTKETDNKTPVDLVEQSAENAFESDTIVSNDTSKVAELALDKICNDEVVKSIEVKGRALEKETKTDTPSTNIENEETTKSIITTTNEEESNAETKDTDKDPFERKIDEKIESDIKTEEKVDKIIVEKKNENKTVPLPLAKSLRSLAQTNSTAIEIPNIISKYKIEPGIPLKKSTKTEMNNNQLSLDKNITMTNNPNVLSPVKIVPLTIISDNAKLMPATVNSAVSITGESEEENDVTLSDATKNDQFEEIIIENNNYEELYENMTPAHATPQILHSEMRPSNSRNDFNQAQLYTNYRRSYVNSHPYSYSITKYPDQYFVDTIDYNKNQIDVGNNYDSTVTVDTAVGQTVRNSDKFITNSYDKLKSANANFWCQKKIINNQPEKLFAQWNHDPNQSAKLLDQSNPADKLQTSYPNRLWRSWRNHHVYIRPIAPGNAELYKGLGNYLSSANLQRVPTYYSSQNMSPRVYENKNTSPANPFQRYGYYNKNNIA